MKNKYQIELENKVIKENDVFVAETAIVLGNVLLKNTSSIWFGAVLRADFDKITIGERTNVQEGVIMHVDHGSPIEIGDDCVIGHGAIVHGAKIGNNTLVGMRATILNGAKIGNCCIIGAHALVTENMVVPDFSMVLGTPGKVVKQLPPSVKDGIMLGVMEYVNEGMKYLKGKI